MIRCVALTALLILVTAPAVYGGGTMKEVRMPDFDHAGMEASYVVTTPSTWKGKPALPLILDLHGAIAPQKKGGVITSKGVWVDFVERVPCIVVAPNARMRGWDRVKGEKDDSAYVLAAMAQVRAKYAVDPKRIYLAGFSSGSDFACRGGLQKRAKFAGTLIVCPGPPNVVGIRGGELEAVKRHPFLFATGEEDYIRKAGAFDAYEHVLGLGGRALYREVPGKGHAFFGIDEYVRLFEDLERLAHEPKKVDWLKLSKAALARDDPLAAWTYARRGRKQKRRDADKLLKQIDELRDAAIADAQEVSAADAPGQAYEAWWAVRTRFAFDTKSSETADRNMQEIYDALGGRDLGRARRDWFRSRGR